MTTLEQLLTVPEVAAKLKVAPSYIYRLVHQHKLPATRIGNWCIRFSPKAVDAYLAGRTTGNSRKVRGMVTQQEEGVN